MLNGKNEKIIFAFIVFRSMEGCEIFKQAYAGFESNNMSKIFYSKSKELKKEMKIL